MKAKTKKQIVWGAAIIGFGVVGFWALRKVSSAVGLGAAPMVPQLPPPTRASCMECVDKHLGAALILITETRDGYPHRLRAIGHLHEAEDESQAWPELHNAIREARKAFQHSNVTPDFEALERLSAAVRA